MLTIHHLILLGEQYARLLGVEEKTVSNRVFSDSKKLGAMKAGGDITVGRFNAAMRWFSENWPAGADWPAEVPRPVVHAEAAE